MRLKSEWMEFPSGDTTCLAYRSRPEPARAALPAVVLVQEIWGVEDFIQDMTHRLATAGYLAFAPDLYSLGGGRPAELAPERVAAVKAFLDTVPPGAWWDEAARNAALAALPAEEREPLAASLAALLGPRDADSLVAVLRDAVHLLRADPQSTGRVGSVGWCNGGGLNGRLACAEPEVSAAVIFYGASPPAESLTGAACPVLGLYGGEDPRITDTVPAFAAGMTAAGKQYEWHVYPGAQHAFFNDTRAAYDVDAARDAGARLLTFFARHLADVARESGSTPG